VQSMGFPGVGIRLPVMMGVTFASVGPMVSMAAPPRIGLSLIKWGQGFVANVAVLLGIVAGAVLAASMGLMHFEKVVTAHWINIVLPFHLGVPEFHPIPIITCIVVVVVMIESLGMSLALVRSPTNRSTRPPSRVAFAPMASARFSAAYSTPFHAPHSPKMLVWWA
jgi:xanthine/uracil permease